MSEVLVSTLNVSFDLEGAYGSGNNTIVLRQITRDFNSISPSGKGSVIVWCYPSDVTQIYASIGSVEPGEVRCLNNQMELIKFSGGKTASLKYPGATNVRTEVLGVSVRRVKNTYGQWEIQTCYPTFTFANNEVTSNIEFYGACKVIYDISFKVLYYHAQIDAPYRGYNGVFITVGSLFALKDDAVTTLDIELDLSSPKTRMEFARVTSKIVLDPLGTWEYPDNWYAVDDANKGIPKGGNREEKPEGTWGGSSSNGHSIDPDNCFEDVRVHEIVYVRITGTIEHESFGNGGKGYTSWYEPKSGLNYQPRYELKFNDPPSWNSREEFEYDQTNTTWRDVFLDVDKKSLISDLSDIYPGLVIL